MMMLMKINIILMRSRFVSGMLNDNLMKINIILIPYIDLSVEC